jgi:KDO2-lipid IV(A) lauroyltransferase
VVLRLAAQICALLPADLAATLATVGGHVEWVVRPAKRGQLAENLAHATRRGPRDRYIRRLVHRNLTTGARRAAGTLWALARPEQASHQVTIVPQELLERLIADGRGVVLCSAHFGPYEAAGVVSRSLPAGTELAVVTDENIIGRALHRSRQRMGLVIVAADASPRELVRILGRGGIVAVIADLHRLGMRGHLVRFLDAECILPGGPAAIARLAQAPLVPFAVYSNGERRWRLELGTPIDPPIPRGGRAAEQRATQQVADAFSAVIQRAPQHWDAVDPIPWRRRWGA